MTTESRGAPRSSTEESSGVGVSRHSTVIALSYATTALVLVALWGILVGPTTQLQPFTFTALVAAAFLAERIALPLSPRSWYTISTPIVLLTGLVGGPVAGAIAGAVTAVGDDAGTWRRRAA